MTNHNSNTNSSKYYYKRLNRRKQQQHFVNNEYNIPYNQTNWSPFSYYNNYYYDPFYYTPNQHFLHNSINYSLTPPYTMEDMFSINEGDTWMASPSECFLDSLSRIPEGNPATNNYHENLLTKNIGQWDSNLGFSVTPTIPEDSLIHPAISCDGPSGTGIDKSDVVNERDISKENQQSPLKLEKKMVIIETPKNLRHLLEIMNDNPVRDDVEYNIDLKLLSGIKAELTELKEMIGMEKIKESVFEQLVYFIQDLHQGNEGDYKHTVIMGPPGTGKTRVAKIIGNMYSKLGVLKNNVFRKVTRNDLIAGYLGQTSIKTKKVIDECLGGVLFIDEAYSLANEDNEDMYSKECLDTLCEALSDHKNDLMVIIAGYENELNNRFFTANSGLESRFIWRFKMEDYSAKELLQIFGVLVLNGGWSYLDEALVNESWFREKKDKFKGLGRDMEALFTYTKVAHGLRIYGKPIELKKKISLEDIDKGYKMFLNNVKKDDRPSFINTIYI